jgi:hypothetical protein
MLRQDISQRQLKTSRSFFVGLTHVIHINEKASLTRQKEGR